LEERQTAVHLDLTRLKSVIIGQNLLLYPVMIYLIGKTLHPVLAKGVQNIVSYGVPSCRQACPIRLTQSFDLFFKAYVQQRFQETEQKKSSPSAQVSAWVHFCGVAFKPEKQACPQIELEYCDGAAAMILYLTGFTNLPQTTVLQSSLQEALDRFSASAERFHM
jgi:hypothetical protein